MGLAVCRALRFSAPVRSWIRSTTTRRCRPVRNVLSSVTLTVRSGLVRCANGVNKANEKVSVLRRRGGREARKDRRIQARIREAWCAHGRCVAVSHRTVSSASPSLTEKCKCRPGIIKYCGLSTTHPCPASSRSCGETGTTRTSASSRQIKRPRAIVACTCASALILFHPQCPPTITRRRVHDHGIMPPPLQGHTRHNCPAPQPPARCH